MSLSDAQRDRLRLAWHDGTCPEGKDCRDRELHADSQTAWQVAGPEVEAAIDQMFATTANEWLPIEWEDWSNTLSQQIPEGHESRYSNPEGAQESIILDCLMAYAEHSAALERVTRLVYDRIAADRHEDPYLEIQARDILDTIKGRVIDHAYQPYDFDVQKCAYEVAQEDHAGYVCHRPKEDHRS